jgi:sterol desaturase/sphingolipid hydroxylase (fatty acid hydroxylase superfamily)
VNSGIIVIIMVALNLFLPGALSLVFLIPQQGLTFTTALVLLLIVIVTFFALRVLLDLIRLVDLTSNRFINQIPGLRSERKISIKRALKEIILVLVLVLVATASSPLLLLIPNVGGWVSLGLSFALLAVCIILIYDAGKTLYAVFQSGIQLFVDKLADAVD